MALSREKHFKTITRSQFMIGYAILSLVFFMLLFAVTRHFMPFFLGSPQQILQALTTLIKGRWWIGSGVILFFLLFGYLFLARLKNGKIPNWLSLIPLMIFYGLFFYLAWSLVTVIAETNFLKMILAIKQFNKQPSAETFSLVFPTEWIVWVTRNEWLLKIALLLHLFLLAVALGLPSYSSPKPIEHATLWHFFYYLAVSLTSFIALLIFVVWIIFTYEVFLVTDPAQYLENYDSFRMLLG